MTDQSRRFRLEREPHPTDWTSIGIYLAGLGLVLVVVLAGG